MSSSNRCSKRLRLSESSSNRRSFSNFSKKNFLDLTGVDTKAILGKPFQLDQLIKLKQAPKELKENVLQMVKMYLRSCGDIFNVDGKESLVDDLMIMFICPLIDYIKQKYKIEDDKLFFQRELDFIAQYYGTSNADQDSTSGRMEIIIMIGKDSKSYLKNVPLIVIENKRRMLSVNSGLNQCLFALSAINDLIEDEHPVYGILNNSEQFKLIKFARDDIKLTNGMVFIDRDPKFNEESFIQNNLQLVDVIFSIITDYLNLEQ